MGWRFRDRRSEGARPRLHRDDGARIQTVSMAVPVALDASGAARTAITTNVRCK
jgi:hypothetical protein